MHNRPGGPREKSKDFKGSMIKLFNSLKKWKKTLVIALILAFFSAVLSTIAPNRLSDLTNVISEGIKPNTEEIKEVTQIIVSNELKGDITYKGTIISVENQKQVLAVLATMNENMSTDELFNSLDSLPDSVKEIVEPKIDKVDLRNASLVLAIIYILSSIFGYIEALLLAYMSNGYAKNLRTDISRKINKLPLKYFDSHETGDILSRVTNDVDSISSNFNNSISSFVTSLTLFLGSVVMMFVTNWIMALTAIASSIFGFVFSFILLKKSQKYFVQRQEELGNINGHIEEIYSGHNVVKAYNGEKAALKEFDKINDKLYECNRKSQFLSGIMQPIMGFIGNFGYVAVCVVGALLVMNDMTSFGTIVAFMIYIRLFTRPLSQIAQALTALQSTAAAAERVFEFLEEEELVDESELKEKVSVEDAKGNIEFKNVSFGYDDNISFIYIIKLH